MRMLCAARDGAGATMRRSGKDNGGLLLLHDHRLRFATCIVAPRKWRGRGIL